MKNHQISIMIITLFVALACGGNGENSKSATETVTEKDVAPEWLLNMILVPEKMIAEDPDAKALFEEYQTPMANLGIDEAGAIAVMEYLRLESSK